VSRPLKLRWVHQFEDAVLALDWEPAGAMLAAGSLSGELSTFHADGEGFSALSMPEQAVLSVKWSFEGKHLAAGGRDGTLGIWQGGSARSLVALGRWVAAISWRPDRPVLAAAAGSDVYILDAAGSGKGAHLLHPGYVNDVAWERSGDLMAASVGGISFYDPDETGRGPSAFAASSGTILKLALSPDGELLAGGKSNGAVVIWQLEGGPGTVLTGSSGGVELLSWSSDGRRLAVAAIDELTIWNCRDGEILAEGLVHCPVPGGCPGGVAFHPWKQLIAWGGEGGAVSIWNPTQASEAVAEHSLDSDITCLAWNPLGDRLAVGTSAGTLACLGLG
jgi:WD40 repeat protein